MTAPSRVKLARIEADLTQQELADIVGVTRQTIGLIEAGKFNPSLKLCIAIAVALNQTLDTLFWNEVDGNDER
jgi:putative transcriptional regulator